MQKLEEKLHELSPQEQAEVVDFIEFLLDKRRKRKTGIKLKQTWAGALKDYRDKYTSVQLQKEAGSWRVE